ncbi:MAG: hypothetical protein IPJ07_05350 [Acidobacteria bacterium]|nr:hypothetical protein [Acidobacteriota bacterium]
MSAAIQLVNHSVIEGEVVDRQSEKHYNNNISLFETAPEQKMRRAMSYVTQLESEVRTLREELSSAERSVTHYEQLLRNAMLREQELRAQLGEALQR